MRIMAFADVQGNLPALEALLEVAKRQRPDEIISLGNAVGVGPHAKEVVDLLRKRRVTCLSGPVESTLAAGEAPEGAGHHLRALEARDVRFLTAGPTERRLRLGGNRVQIAWSPWTRPFEPVPGGARDEQVAAWLRTARADAAAWAGERATARSLEGGGFVASAGRAGLNPEGPEAPYLMLSEEGARVGHVAYDPERFVLDMLKQELPLNGVPEPLRRRF